MVDAELDRATVGTTLAVFLAGAALALPWWTVEGTFGPAQVIQTTTAGPFDTGPGLVEGWEATLVGVLALGALVGFLLALTVLVGSVELHPAWELRIPALAYGSGALLLVAVLMALVAWPDGGLWDAAAAPGSATEAAAGLGWYAALVGAILGPASAWDARKRGVLTGKEGDPRPGPGRTRA